MERIHDIQNAHDTIEGNVKEMFANHGVDYHPMRGVRTVTGNGIRRTLATVNVKFPKKGNSKLIKELVENGWTQLRGEKEANLGDFRSTKYAGYIMYARLEKEHLMREEEV